MTLSVTLRTEMQEKLGFFLCTPPVLSFPHERRQVVVALWWLSLRRWLCRVGATNQRFD